MQDIRQGLAVNDANSDGPNDPCADNFRGYVFGDKEEGEEGYQNEDVDNLMAVSVEIGFP